MSDHSFLQKPGLVIHMIGIGGVSMCALAEVLRHRGFRVTGSDVSESAATERLAGLGIPVMIGHAAENVGEAACVVRTAAVHDDNCEVEEARRRGLPVYERAQVWGLIMQEYDTALCFAGTHGKTTTTSMMTQVALTAALDPTVMVGAHLPALGGGHRVGQGGLIIMEACEYCNSFLSFSPTIAVILNIEADHLDFFRDIEEIQASFRAFALKTPEDTGLVVLNADDPLTAALGRDLPRQVLTFGLTKQADVTAVNLCYEDGYARFDAKVRGELWAHIALRVPGKHNVLNALAVIACAASLGAHPETVAQGLYTFGGASRRFEHKGSFQGALVVDDYAHHPSEIMATLASVRSMGFRRTLCVFQPHTYSRTLSLFDDFVEALSLADVAIVTEVYAAREANDGRQTAARLAEKIPGAVFAPTLQDAVSILARLAGPGDLVLSMGAGSITGLYTLLAATETVRV